MAAAHPYEKELRIALLAVQRAAILTKAVFRESSKGTLSKDDKSPVTIGDFGAQALIIAALRHNFPADEIIAEEEASTFDQNEELKQTVWAHVKRSRPDDEDGEKELGGEIRSVQDMVKLIDLGKSQGGAKGRVWAIDPIDGTKGFLRGGQYAVCLALIEDGEVKVGVLGCPNLPVDDAEPITEQTGGEQTSDEGKGVLFGAILGQGATSRAMTAGVLAAAHPIRMKSLTNVADATFCESVEAAHSSHDDQSQITHKLGIVKPSVRMDSQAKYASIARGAGDLYLRLPVKKTYVEKIWDHAAGDLIVREAGGQVTDATGKRLDFSKGRTLIENKGVVAAPRAVHAEVLAAVNSVLAGS